MSYMQDERIQSRRSIKKGNQGQDIKAEGRLRTSDINFQFFEAGELGYYHCSVEFLENDKSKD